MSSWTENDRAAMTTALALAARGLGRVAPNPAVGCVLINEGRIVGRGWTQPGGRPHAETVALAEAGAAARGATAYVTLEPCAHVGKTGPCAEALIGAGVSRVVSALEDPDPRVCGRGHGLLQAAGIDVAIGLMATEAGHLNAGFLSRVKTGRPLVKLKLATSFDGRIATRSGESQWITGVEARTFVQTIRSRYDAVMVGSGTALADDPALTLRLAGLDHETRVRIIVDSRLRTPLSAQFVRGANRHPSVLITVPHGSSGAEIDRIGAYEAARVTVLTVPADPQGRVDLTAMMQALGARGLTRVLCEGGAELAASLLRADLVDRIAWFRSPGIIGGDGRAAIGPCAIDRLVHQVRFETIGHATLGEDRLDLVQRVRQ